MSEANRVLLINDLSGCGKVALSAMIPVLSAFGYSVSNLPTAIVSNTLDYGQFQILDTTDYMEKTANVWKNLEFHFDCISTGFICNEKQAEIIEEIIEQNRDAYVCVDPIMGDDGRLYNGISMDIVSHMKKLVAHADVIVPNITEAELLVFGEASQEKKDEAYYQELAFAIKRLGAKSVVITSICDRKDSYYMIAVDPDNRVFKIAYENIDARFPGTGDVFSSIMLGHLLSGSKFEDAILKASLFLYESIQENLRNKDYNQGLKIENRLSELCE